MIWVAGVNKLVPNLDAGIRRLREVALPMEDARIKSAGGPGSFIGNLVLYERQVPGRTRLVLATGWAEAESPAKPFWPPTGALSA